MTPTRKGKIARLPRPIRDELNTRLDNGEETNALIPWLNSLPEVQALIAREFRGVPVSQHNLSQCRRGGFQDWLTRQETRQLAGQFLDQASAADAEGRRPFSETLSQWVGACYAVASHSVADAEGEEQWRLLREMCRDVVRLRQRDHASEKLEVQRERMSVNLQIESARYRRRPPAPVEGYTPPDQPV